MENNLQDILKEAEDVYVEVAKTGDSYSVNAELLYEEEVVELNFRLDSERELGLLYSNYLEDLSSNVSASVFGNSSRLKREVGENDTWGFAAEDEWAVDAKAALERSLDMEKASYEDIINHVSSSALGTITRSQAVKEHPSEDYFFYLRLVNELRKEKPQGFRGRIKQRAKSKAKDKALEAAEGIKKDIENEYRRMEREGEIEEMKNRFKQEAKNKVKEKAGEALSSSKKKVGDEARNELQNLKSNAFPIEEKLHNFLWGREEEEREVSEPSVKIRRENVTIYDYREQEFRMEE